MSHEAFQQAIFNEPDDDALRLIYADWLDENGDPQWAEFIRVQCELATLTPASDRFVALDQRQQELRLLLWHRDLIPSLSFSEQVIESLIVRSQPFQRGFPFAYYVFIDQWGGAPSLPIHEICDLLQSRLCPSTIQGLEISGFSIPDLKLLLEHDLLGSMRQLEICSGEWMEYSALDADVDDLARTIANTPQLQGLRSLALEADFSDEGLKALAGASNLRALGCLRLGYVEASGEGFRALAQSSLAKQIKVLSLSNIVNERTVIEALTNEVWPKVHTLEIRESLFNGTLLKILARSNAFPNLVSLDLSGNPFVDNDLETLISNQDWRLRTLNLSECELKSTAVQTLVKSSFVDHLHTLTLFQNEFGAQGASALAKSEHLTRLRRLDLRCNHLEARQYLALTKGELLSRLTELRLGCFRDTPPCTAAEGAELMRALESPNIRHLDLTGIPIGARGAKAMASKEWASRLRILELSSCRIGESGGRALLDVLDPAILARATLYENRIPKSVREQFEEKFGSERVLLM